LSEDILERASDQLAPEHFEFENLLGEIRAERAAAAEARAGEEAARREAEDLRVALAERRDTIEQERANILAAAQREAEDALALMRREVDAIKRREAARDFDARAADETLKQMDAELGKLAKSARPRREAAPQPVAFRREVIPGDTIHVRDIPQLGTALTAVGDDGRVEVQFGSLRMKVSVDRIDRIEQPGPSGEKVAVPTGPSVGMELDLRGERAEAALERLENYLDAAFRGGLPFVRIIHGKGTGALRAAIREALGGHSLVRRFESAQPQDGGDGVTIALLAG
jgi:DNA mismatch repair protein MutS2